MAACRFTPGRSFVCVGYPGIVENDSKALATLGGPSAIAEILNNSSKRLELRYRPEDIFCKSAYANRRETTQFLMRVRRLRKKSNPEETCLESEILGIIPVTYSFSTMMDFQFLPMVRRPATSMIMLDSYESVADKVCIQRLVGSEWLNCPDAPLFSIPILFSRLDNPVLYLYRKDKQQQPGASSSQRLISSARKKRHNLNQIISYETAEVPSKPSKAATMYYLTRISPQELDIVRKFFEERPIWTRNALLGKTGMKLSRLQLALPLLAYYFSTGPWRKTWVRFGYDPRGIPAAKCYQLLDFRIREKFNEPLAAEGIGQKRSLNLYETLLVRKRPQVTAPSMHILNEVEEEEDKRSIAAKEGTYIFRPDLKPAFRQMSYQVCDVFIPEVQELLTCNNGQEAACDKTNGWCVPLFADKCRVAMASYLSKSATEGAMYMDMCQDEAADATLDDDPDDPDYVP